MWLAVLDRSSLQFLAILSPVENVPIYSSLDVLQDMWRAVAFFQLVNRLLQLVIWRSLHLT